jgi:hypothetical protein
VRFSIRHPTPAIVWVSLVKRSGTRVKAPDWSTTNLSRDAPPSMDVRLEIEQTAASNQDGRVPATHRLRRPVPLQGRTLTYTFTVDRARGTVDLTINGVRVCKGALWSGVDDIDDFAPMICADSSQQFAAPHIELVPCDECD